MTLTRDHLRRIVDVAYARDLEFVELVGLAELDPATAFRGKTLRRTDLRRQDLAGFDFTGAVFIDCDFTGARLAGCVLRGADLSRTKGVTPEMLAEAITDAETRRPFPSIPFWATGHAPSWAETWGHDQYGAWVVFRVPGTEVTQRMRWIPPGEFLMGSPEDEPGRSVGEGPRHKVTLAQGFWMFETACTEALWEAVCGPLLRARGPEFPATGVSWDDAEDFAWRLNAMLPGLGIGLPSEARWEYACRAGTGTAYSFGASITKDQVCFGSRSPVPVGTLSPNAWGLHEMHGNVWEWCEDHWHDNYRDAPDDGSAWLDGGAAVRVFRGGSWGGGARGVRAAYRDGLVPGARYVRLGFRCVRGHARSEAEQAEPVALARGRKRGAPPTARAKGGAKPRSGV